MSRLQQLIDELCPDGVEYKPLGEIVQRNLGGGTPARSNPEFWNGEIPWASVGDLTATTVHIESTRQRITEVGLNRSSTSLVPAGYVVVAVKIAPGTMRVVHSPIAINQDIRGLKLDRSINPRFLTYYFKTIQIQGNGAIVKSITNQQLLKVSIPVPPLPVQEEIVRILDTFTVLEAELEAELVRRKQQYAYFREQLLTFDNGVEGGVELMSLAQVGDFFSGLRSKNSKDFISGNSVFLPYKQVYARLAVDYANLETVQISEHENQNTLQYGDIIFTGSSEGFEDVGLTSVVTDTPPHDVYLNSFCFGLRPKNPEFLHPRFTKFLFRSNQIRKQIRLCSNGVTRINVSKKQLAKVQIPVPPLEVQKDIADKLDAFDALVNDLTAGLPAEIAARRKQYEYYREQLLTFPEKKTPA